MSLRRLNIGIIGCGTAGPAAAVFLTRAGHDVTIYERVPNPHPIGAGIILQPTGLSVLARLGIAEQVVARGAILKGLQVDTAKKRRLINLEYQRIADGLYGLGIHRGVIFEQLFNLVQKEKIKLVLGTTIEDLAKDGHRQWCVTPTGERFGPHDLIIVADGAKSRLRDDTDHEIRKSVRPYPWGALWFVANNTTDLFQTQLHQVVESTKYMYGILPTGLGPGTANTPLASIYWSVRADQVEALRQQGLQAWKEEALRLIPASQPLIEQITDIEQLLFTQYHDVDMPIWHTHNVVYIGDAAHAMSPQLGQGCNLALYDAMILSDTLIEAFQHQDYHYDRLATALWTYSNKRIEHLGFYQFATRWLTPFFQGDSRVLGWMRDWGMGIASRIGWVNYHMTLSMVGTKTGFLSGEIPLDGLIKLLPDANVGDNNNRALPSST